jgi:hypothetical protein
MPKPSSKPPSAAPAPQALQTIDPGALAGVSGGARSGRSASASSGSGGGGGGGGGGGSDDALVGALTDILHSLHSISNQPSHGFGAQEMMLFMMMMQQRNAAPVVVQPGLPAIYSNGSTRIF